MRARAEVGMGTKIKMRWRGEITLELMKRYSRCVGRRERGGGANE